MDCCRLRNAACLSVRSLGVGGLRAGQAKVLPPARHCRRACSKAASPKATAGCSIPGCSAPLPIDNLQVRHIMDHMKTVTVRELRNEFPRIEAWIHEGESINISKRGKIIATLVPALGASRARLNAPRVDIMARLQETWSGRVFTEEQVAAMRADELANDLG